MAWFDDQMAALDAQYVAAFGETAVYINANGGRTEDTGVLVDDETVVERDSQKVRERKFSFRRARLGEARLNGVVEYGEEQWPVFSIEKEGDRIILTCQRYEQLGQFRANHQRRV